MLLPDLNRSATKIIKMRSTTLLRFFVLLEWAFLLISMKLSFALEHTLPEPLRDWIAADTDAEVSKADLIILFSIVPLLASALVGAIGLLFLKRWAAWVYLVSMVLGYLIVPFTGPSVEHAIAYAVDEVSVVFSGMVIALAFFSDALDPKKPDTEPAAAANRSMPPPLS
jgi:nitrate reductase NapE component